MSGSRGRGRWGHGFVGMENCQAWGKGMDFQGLSTGENLVLGIDCWVLSQLCCCGMWSGHFISGFCPF